MAKIQLVIKPASGEDLDGFRQQMLDGLAPALLEASPTTRLKLTLSGPKPPRLSLIPFAKRPVALLSFWSDGVSRDPNDWTAIVRAHGLEAAGYLVEESTPRAYERDWPDGRPTPGVGLLTLLRRRRGLDDETFLHRWHQGHTPLSLRIHPLWSYIRNVVRQPVIPGSPPLDGIVEEHFRRPADLLDPLRFFGGPLRALPNMVRVGIDIARFLDLRALQTYLVEEIHLRS